MRALLPLVLFAQLSLQADGFVQLKEQLGRLPGTAAVKGNLELRTWAKGGKGKEVEESQGSGSVWVEDGPQGLRLIWSRGVIQQLEQEAKLQEKDPKAKTPLEEALGKARPTTVLAQVSAAAPLLRDLERAKLLEEKAEPWNGQSARLLTLEPGLKPMTEEDRKRVKKFESRLQVWVNEAGFPLASRETSYVKASVMLMTIENRTETNTTYAKVGDRLVVARREKKEHNTLPIVGEVQSHTVYAFTAQ